MRNNEKAEWFFIGWCAALFFKLLLSKAGLALSQSECPTPISSYEGRNLQGDGQHSPSNGVLRVEYQEELGDH
jgi:hypothetical protein